MSFLLLALIFVLSMFVNIITIKNGHNWGDDFAQYIINGYNFVQLKPYMSGISLDNHLISFPGFSLILAPFIKIFGLNFIIMKFIIVIFWYGAVVLIYKMLKEVTTREYARIATALLCVSSFVYTYKQNVLSDIPFVFFVCLAVYCFNKEKLWMTFLLAVSLAFWIRPVGCLLFLASAIMFTIDGSWKKLLVLVLVLIGNTVMIVNIFSPNQSLVGLMHFNFDALFYNIDPGLQVVFTSLFQFFYPAQTNLSFNIVAIFMNFIQVVAPVGFLVLTALFILRVAAKKVSFLEVFSFMYVCVFAYFAARSQTPPDAFVRFILPLVPYVFVFGFYIYSWGLWKKLKINLIAVSIGICLSVNVYNIYFNRDFNDSVLVKENLEMIAWVKNNVGNEEHFMFRRPRFLALMTGKLGTSPMIANHNEDDFDFRVSNLGITYIILYKDSSGYLLNRLNSNDRFRVAWENKTYKIYKVMSISKS